MYIILKWIDIGTCFASANLIVQGNPSLTSLRGVCGLKQSFSRNGKNLPWVELQWMLQKQTSIWTGALLCKRDQITSNHHGSNCRKLSYCAPHNMFEFSWNFSKTTHPERSGAVTVFLCIACRCFRPVSCTKQLLGCSLLLNITWYKVMPP